MKRKKNDESMGGAKKYSTKYKRHSKIKSELSESVTYELR